MSLRNFWYIACVADDLRPGPKAVRLFGEHYVLWRDGSGQAAAAVDRCAHRNAPLSEGEVKGGCLACPYHGWSYDAEGRCNRIPSLADGRPIPASAKIKTLPVCEQDGYVWVCPGDRRPDHPPRRFPHCGEDGWITFRMRTLFDSDVESCLENFLDCPHTATVHRGWFRNPDPREVDAVMRRHAEGVEVEFANEPATGSLVSRLFYPKGANLKHTDRFLMPNLSRVDYEFGPQHHYIITSQASPVTERRTEVFTVITFRHGSIGPLVRWFFQPLCHHIIRQDVAILKRQGRNLRRFGGPDYAHVETDLVGLHMHTLRRRAELGEAPPKEISERTLRIRF